MLRTYYDVVCVVNKCIESRHTGVSSRLIKKHSQLRLMEGGLFCRGHNGLTLTGVTLGVRDFRVGMTWNELCH